MTLIPLFASNFDGVLRVLLEIGVMLASPIGWFAVLVMLRQEDRPAAVGIAIFLVVIYAAIFVDMYFFW